MEILDGVADRRGELAADRGRDEAADHQAAAVRGDEEPVRFIGPFFEDHPDPEGLKAPQATRAAHADPFDREHIPDEADRLALPGAALVEAEGEIDEGHVEPEEPDHRPGADRDKPMPTARLIRKRMPISKWKLRDGRLRCGSSTRSKNASTRFGDRIHAGRT